MRQLHATTVAHPAITAPFNQVLFPQTASAPFSLTHHLIFCPILHIPIGSKVMSFRKLQKTSRRFPQHEQRSFDRPGGGCHNCCAQEPQDRNRTNPSQQDTIISLGHDEHSQQSGHDIDLKGLVLSERRAPCHISCFSPLDLPTDLFVYTLQLLSGGDLWKLCQVSKSMRRQVLLFMPRSRRLEFEIVRILHQGNPYSQHERYRLAMEKDYDEMYERHWRIYRTYVLGITEPATPGSPTSQVDEPDYQRSPLGLETPSTAPTEANFISRGERRDIYWALQAETLLQSIIKDTPYEIKLVDRETSEVTEDAGQSQTHIGPLGDIDATPVTDLLDSSDRDPVGNPSSPSVKKRNGNSTRSWIKQLFQGNTDQPPPLPMDRFKLLENVMFDSNLVSLAHRRAFVNCARYMTAEIEASFQGMVSIVAPKDPQFCAAFMDNSKVSIGPYLRALTPFDEYQDAGVPLDRRVLRPDTIISPPRELSGYIQVMLWSRCLSDLVLIYNRIHLMHNRRNSASSPSTSNSTDPSTTRRSDRNGYGTHQKRRNQAPGSCSELSNQTSCSYFHSSDLSGQLSQNLCCTAPYCRSNQLQMDHEFDLRRYRMEERNRKDTLIKQELLSLCNMACGLFAAPVLVNEEGDPIAHTIMTHLRLGSPWRKGVWREGEWRHAPIDMDHDIDEVSMARRLDQEQEHQIKEGMHRRNGTSDSHTHDRHDLVLDLTSVRYAKEGEDDNVDEGPWQKLCLAAIHFLVDEDLIWAGNSTNNELNALRVTEDNGAWYYLT
ncbi:hypothetical protein B0O80DRAFT_176369 [Mortierella sp. GBAus27b]|nr:hypothetical protein B0O80DRAFT_176369 [Mortierella sp. GBAus27b]